MRESWAYASFKHGRAICRANQADLSLLLGIDFGRTDARKVYLDIRRERQNRPDFLSSPGKLHSRRRARYETQPSAFLAKIFVAERGIQ